MIMVNNPRQKAEGKRQRTPPTQARVAGPKLCLLPFARCLLPFLLLALASAPLRVNAQEAPEVASASTQETADLELVSALERVISRAIARAEPSVVSIARRRRDTAAQFAADSHPGFFRQPRDATTPLDPNFAANEFATGVVIDARGLILTSSRVLTDEPQDNDFFVTTVDRKVFPAKMAEAKKTDRKVFPMKVKASDAMSDLAVLEPLESSSVRTGDFTPITFGDAATLRKGQIVIALGNPYGIARDGQASASQGIVANLSRKANTAGEDDSQKTLHDYGTLIQTDAKLNLGTSGGALINVRGEMVGLTTSLAAAAGFEQPAGYAIPIDRPMLRIIRALREGREVEYGLLGVAPQNLSNDQMKQGVPGVLISNVVPGGPAATANIKANDIITRVDGNVIYDEDALRLHVSKLPPGSITNLTLQRSTDSKPTQRRVVLAKLPVLLPQTYTERAPAWRGAVIDYRLPKRRTPDQFPGFVSSVEDFSTPSVAVREIEEGSAAWQAGLREGMLISHVGSAPVGSPAEFHKAVASQTGAIKLQILSPEGGRQRTLVVPVE